MSMVFAQLTHAIGLNDVCDALRLQQRQRGPLAGLDGAVTLRLDALSVRDEQLESLFH